MISVKVLPDFDSRRCLLTALLFLYASNSLSLSFSSCFGSMFNWVAFDFLGAGDMGSGHVFPLKEAAFSLFL
ncbi:hypothetical protein SDJN03_17655, partial [Cucurbita argyrosperma subsp. sororia]